MARVILIHWNPAEAGERTARLETLGYQVAAIRPDGMATLHEMRSDPPGAVIIDLGRMPSHGRAVALALRQQKATRPVPLIFAGGAPEKVNAIRKLLPDAFFREWEAIPAAIEQALREPPTAPVAPGAMAGYSGTPLVKKLGIRAGSRVLLLGAPRGFEATLGEMPEGADVRTRVCSGAALVLAFVKSHAELERRFKAAVRALDDRGGVWLIWPKKTAAIPSDLTQAGVRAFGLARQFVDYKICAVDATWSGLLFTRRRSASRGA